MKKLIAIILILTGGNLAIAQQKYVTFTIAGKHGITDTLGNEIVKPVYGYCNLIEAKGLIYLQDFSEKPDIIFNAKTGIKQLYESVYNDRVKIKNVPYSLISKNGTSFLLSEQTDKVINLTEDYYDLQDCGQYIISKYFPKSPTLKNDAKDKNGVLLPPPPIEPLNTDKFAVLDKEDNLKPIMKGEFKDYLLLYKVPKEPENDSTIQIVNINNRTTPNFDFIVFSKDNTHNLYNGKMALVKTFVLADADQELLIDACNKIVKVDLASSYVGNYIMPSMISDESEPTPIADPGFQSKSDERKPEPVKPKIDYPFFYLKKLDNGNTLFALQKTEQISNPIFEANTKSDVSFNEKSNTITVSIDDKKDSKFNVNPKTGVLYLPKIYLAGLGLKVL